MIAALAAAMAITGGASDVILPGKADLPVIEGSSLMADCLMLQERLAASGKPFQCVGTPMARADEITRAYGASARTLGWLSSGGLANMVSFHRPLSDGRCEGLAFAGFPTTEAMAPSDLAMIIVLYSPTNDCPPPRPVP